MRHYAAALALALLAAVPASAQEAPDWTPGYGTLFLQTHSPLVNDAGILETLFTHRFNQPVNEAGGTDLFGLDNGANIGIGLSWVPVRGLAAEVYRASNGGDYEFAAKLALLTPRKECPVGISVRAGVNWLTKYEIEDDFGGFGQLLVAWTVGDRVTLAAAPSYSSNSPLFKDAFNVPLAVQVRFGRGLYAGGEYVFRNGDLDGSVGQWSFAIEKAVYRHRFLVWIGNSPATTVDQIVAGDYAGGVTDSNIRLGFNISRQFRIGGD
ncbi:MAG: hypothetical protein KJ062_08225 [Thermoanaerobaculia bacterium]|nr:hypothetical protein [Thermoanaerobaculia bacterium]